MLCGGLVLVDPPAEELSSADLVRRCREKGCVGWVVGRSWALGWVHFLITRRRCQRSSVAGVTIQCARSALGRSRPSPANSARSAQSTPGLGLAQHRHLVTRNQ